MPEIGSVYASFRAGANGWRGDRAMESRASLRGIRGFLGGARRRQADAGGAAAVATGRWTGTAALLTYLERPLEIRILFREVRARVLESTGGEDPRTSMRRYWANTTWSAHRVRARGRWPTTCRVLRWRSRKRRDVQGATVNLNWT